MATTLNQFFNQTLSRGSISSVGPNVSYNSSTGVISDTSAPANITWVPPLSVGTITSNETNYVGLLNSSIVNFRSQLTFTGLLNVGGVLLTVSVPYRPSKDRFISTGVRNSLTGYRTIQLKLATTGILSINTGSVALAETLDLDGQSYSL